MPAKNRVGFDDRGYVLEGLLAQLLANGGQDFALTVAQPKAPLHLVTEDTILRHQVLIAQQ